MHVYMYVDTYLNTLLILCLSKISIFTETIKEVFDRFYHRLIKILPVKNIKSQLVSTEIITLDDSEEIDVSENKSSYVLEIIAKSLEAGITRSFYELINILNDYGGDVKLLAKNILTALNTNTGRLMDTSYFIVNTCNHD